VLSATQRREDQKSSLTAIRRGHVDDEWISLGWIGIAGSPPHPRRREPHSLRYCLLFNYARDISDWGVLSHIGQEVYDLIITIGVGIVTDS
jgi:hypothetical protein